MKKFLSMFTALIFALGFCFSFPELSAEAATKNDIDQSDVFLKQAENDTCTLCAATMLIRRVAIMAGRSNWRDITEYAVRNVAWNNGLKGSFTYDGITIVHKGEHYDLSGKNKAQVLQDVLSRCPEGIVAYDRDYVKRWSTGSGSQHAVLLTDYTNGVFYCAEPAGGKPAGRIPISQSGVTIDGIDDYWYCSSPLVSLNAMDEMSIPTFTLDKSSYVAGDTVTVRWKESSANSNLSHYWLSVYTPNGNDIQRRIDPPASSTSFVAETAGEYRIIMQATPKGSEHGEGSLVSEQSINVLDPAVVGHVMSESEAAGRTIPDGDYWIFNRLGSDYYLDVPGEEISSGGLLNMWHCGSIMPSVYDVWTVKYLNNGFYSILQKNSSAGLDVCDAKMTRCTYVQMCNYNGNNAQQWSISRTENGYQIRSRLNNFYLDVSNGETESGTRLWTYSQNDSSAQLFGFIPYTPNEQPLEDGTYSIRTAVDTNYCMEAEGTNVQIWQNADQNDTFDIQYQGNGWYKILDHDSKLSLTVDAPNTDAYLSARNNIMLKAYSGERGQLWKIRKVSDGRYVVFSKLNGLVADMPGSTAENGKTVFCYPYTGNDIQIWLFVRTTPEDEYTKALQFEKSDNAVKVIGCDNSVQNVVIPEWYDGLPVTGIGERAFANCSKMTSISIPESITSIKHAAFLDCSSLKQITIPKSITSIGTYAFSGCFALKDIIVAEDNPSYTAKDGVLFNKDMTKLIKYSADRSETEYEIPDTVKIIDSEAFSHSVHLTEIVIPRSVTTIWDGVFSTCTGLKHIVIPDSVTDIHDYAFVSCSGLEEITIPRSVAAIGQSVFAYTQNLVIKGYSDSIAADYAAKNNISFVRLDAIPLVGENVKLSQTDFPYTGKQVKVGNCISVKYNGKSLKYGTDFTLSYANNINAGYETASVTVTGIGEYTGTVTKQYTIVPAQQAAPQLSYIDNGIRVKWTADSFANGFQVMYCQNESFKNTDPTYHLQTYSAGKSTANLTKYSKPGETWYVKVRAFVSNDGTTSGKKYGTWSETAVIRPVTSVSLSQSVFPYTGKPIKVGSYISVRSGDKKLKYGTDFTMEYSDNITAGFETAAVTVKGIGEYSGTIVQNYTITPEQQAAPLLAYIDDGIRVKWTADSSADGFQVMYCQNDSFLSSDPTYHIAAYGAGRKSCDLTKYADPDEIWYIKVRAFVSDDGTTAGKKYGTWSETAVIRPITSVTLSQSVFPYTGKQVKVGSHITVKSGDTKLKYGTDFTMEYAENITAGYEAASVMVKGIGEYSGTIIQKYTITPAKQDAPQLSYIDNGIRVKWNADSSADGSQVMYCQNDSFLSSDPTYHIAAYGAGRKYCDLTKYANPDEVWYIKVRAFVSDDGTTAGKKYGTWSETAVIRPITSVTLSQSVFPYTGKQIKVGSYITVKSGDTKLKYGTDYTMEYADNIQCGFNTASVIVTGIGEYSGTITAQYTITPAKQTLPKLSSITGGFKVAWKADESASGYQVIYSKDPEFNTADPSYHSQVYSADKTSANLTKYAKSGETWYVKVRAFITADGSTSGTKYGVYSDAASIIAG